MESTTDRKDTRFKKGREKTGGRKAGTPNRSTKALREALTPIMTAYFSGLADPSINFQKSWAEDLNQMSPADRAHSMEHMAPFVMPKLQSVEIKEQNERGGLRAELDALQNEGDGEDDE